MDDLDLPPDRANLFEVRSLADAVNLVLCVLGEPRDPYC